MVAAHTPSPLQMSEARVEALMCPHTVRFDSLHERTKALKESKSNYNRQCEPIIVVVTSANPLNKITTQNSVYTWYFASYRIYDMCQWSRLTCYCLCLQNVCRGKGNSSREPADVSLHYSLSLFLHAWCLFIFSDVTWVFILTHSCSMLSHNPWNKQVPHISDSPWLWKSLPRKDVIAVVYVFFSVYIPYYSSIFRVLEFVCWVTETFAWYKLILMPFVAPPL